MPRCLYISFRIRVESSVFLSPADNSNQTEFQEREKGIKGQKKQATLFCSTKFVFAPKELRISNNPGDVCIVSMKKIDEVFNDLWHEFIAAFFNNLIVGGKKEILVDGRSLQ